MRTMRTADAPQPVVHWPMVTISTETADALREAATAHLDQTTGEARARLQEAIDELSEVLERSSSKKE